MIDSNTGKEIFVLMGQPTTNYVGEGSSKYLEILQYRADVLSGCLCHDSK